jgi:gamma-glutamyltranspeptidase/glutathione hydrolase
MAGVKHTQRSSLMRYVTRVFLIWLTLLAGTLPALQAHARTAPTNVASAVRVVDQNPEAATGYAEREVVRAPHFMAVSANPLATAAGRRMLERGGSAVDASIAMQWVLSLVEPQSSGLGGGGFAVTYDARSGLVEAYDGRETAPASATPDRFMHAGKPLPFNQAVHNGLSVGVPGMVAMLWKMHRDQGRLPWSALFEPAIELAEQGFPVSPRLHSLVAQNQYLKQSPSAAGYFYGADGSPHPVGYRLKNPQLAKVFRTLAVEGVRAFYMGSIAKDIVDAVQAHPQPGDLTLEDMASYQPRVGDALCMEWRSYELCGAGPPSSGPLAVMQMMGILGRTPLEQLSPDSALAVHYFAEAGRLAFADRDFYVADPRFEQVPAQPLLDPDYLALRAALIQPDRSMGKALPGDPVNLRDRIGIDATAELPSTSHMVAADAQGNVVSMTTSIETAFGSKIMVDGFLLNNQLTDFSLVPVDDLGRPIANRVQGGKRPRSSMAPMLVLEQGRPYLAIGSPGGSAIINYVAKSLAGVLLWNLNVQQAIDLPNYGSRNAATEVETGRLDSDVLDQLRTMGHPVREQDFPSGLHGIRVTTQGLEGGADPRREGRAEGG